MYLARAPLPLFFPIFFSSLFVLVCADFWRNISLLRGCHCAIRGRRGDRMGLCNQSLEGKSRCSFDSSSPRAWLWISVDFIWVLIVLYFRFWSIGLVGACCRSCMSFVASILPSVWILLEIQGCVCEIGTLLRSSVAVMTRAFPDVSGERKGLLLLHEISSYILLACGLTYVISVGLETLDSHNP